MATILEAPLSKSKAKLHSIKIDMTPMVDLGFLLITFFIFTTSMMEPTTMKLTMPKDDPIPQPFYTKTLLTVLVDKDRAFVYEGSFDGAVAENKIRQTNFHLQTGVGYFIREKQKLLDVSNEKDDLFVAIKPLATASYQDVMDGLDEMLINRVKRYGIMNLSNEEKQFLDSKKQ